MRASFEGWSPFIPPFIQRHKPLRGSSLSEAYTRYHTASQRQRAQPTTSRTNIREIQTPPPPPPLAYLSCFCPPGVYYTPTRPLLFLSTLVILHLLSPFTQITIIGHTGPRSYSDHTWNPSILSVMVSFPSTFIPIFLVGSLQSASSSEALVQADLEGLHIPYCVAHDDDPEDEKEWSGNSILRPWAQIALTSHHTRREKQSKPSHSNYCIMHCSPH